MFRGVSFLNLDAKGRLAIPARYREELQSCCDSNLVVTVDRERCLLVYPKPTWNEIERRLDRLPSFNEQTRTLLRIYVGHAQDVEMDGQGRVLLPPGLRQFAAMDKRVALVGQGKKFELWNEETWNAKCDVWLSQVDLSQLETSPDIASLNI